MCVHRSSCPAADSTAVGSLSAGSPAVPAAVAHVVAAHPEQGWNLLCDGTIVFDDTGELRPDGGVVAPRRVPAGRLAIAA
ncbi:DUF5999 family protein [Streptomyces parvulus]|uniref:DUF5999 family protein n=1 Tax=Streptomyces parvulus TaxID=146923 RepID=UPI001CF991AC|nr:DUF5999 family protein [Streptomyces parvulus]